MEDKSTLLDMFGGNKRRENPTAHPVKEPAHEAEEDRCAAFGFLRGLDARALMLELRFRTGDSGCLSYSLLASWWHNPSVGLLLRFEGGTLKLVLIRGSNLDCLVGNGAANLTDRGLQRHRITYMREMGEEELRRAGKGAPTIDRIEVAEFESHDDMRGVAQE